MNLRTWQKLAKQSIYELMAAAKKDRATIAACPGAGKTSFTISLVTDRNLPVKWDTVCIVVPSRALKTQWKRALKKAGVFSVADVSNESLENRQNDEAQKMYDPEAPVSIFTYAQIATGAASHFFRVMCARHRVFVVFDEVHHADDEAQYGKSLYNAFENAVFKLSLSGTPFNTKGGRLAFCDIEKIVNNDGTVNNRTKVDFSYSYGEALQARGTEHDPKVVRSVQFVRWAGTARWRSTNLLTGETRTHEVTGRESDPLSPLVSFDGNYPKRMIDAALERLEDIRKSHPRAGMLITGMSIEHCEEIVEYVKSKGVRDVSAIMHDTPNATDKIDEWDRSGDRVLVAIKMISEGVDIKRLRVGVYLSNVLTQMFFIQFIGRFVRWDETLNNQFQFACVFVPEHDTIIKYAKEIERMVMEAEDSLLVDPPAEGPPPPPPPPKMYEGFVSDSNYDGLIENGGVMEAVEADVYTIAIQRAGLHGMITEQTVKRLADALKEQGVFVDAPKLSHEPEPEIDEKTLYRKMNNELVNAIVNSSQRIGGKEPWTHQNTNAYANRAVGIKAMESLTPVSILKQRVEILRALLLRVRSQSEAGVA